MFVLKEYYPFQMFQIFAGVAPYAYRSNSKKQFSYAIITILSCLLQTGFGLAYMYWILPSVTSYLKKIYFINKVTEVEATNESTTVLFRIVSSLLINIIAIVLRVYNIVQSSKLPIIFEEIDRIDSLIRITDNYSKLSRRRVFGLVFLLLFISWIIHAPYWSTSICGKLYDLFFYHFCNSIAQFTITSVEWCQAVFLVLLKRRYSFLNKKLNLMYTSVMDSNHSEEAIISTWFDDSRNENEDWSVPESVDDSVENGGKNKIWNYLNIIEKTSSNDQTMSKINERKVSSTRKQKKTTSRLIIPSNILRISTAQELEILRIAHQELSTTLMRITNYFRFRIFLSFCTDVISLLDKLHYIVQQIIEPWKGTSPLRVRQRRPEFHMSWALEYFARIICIVWSNSSTKSEAKNTLLHLERLQVPLFLRNYQEALEELGYFKRYMQSEVAFSSSGALIDFQGSLILRVMDTSINYAFLILQQTFRKK